MWSGECEGSEAWELAGGVCYGGIGESCMLPRDGRDGSVMQ